MAESPEQIQGFMDERIAIATEPLPSPGLERMPQHRSPRIEQVHGLPHLRAPIHHAPDRELFSLEFPFTGAWILDEDALMDLLERGHLGGVGLDVYAGEPVVNPKWFTAPRTLLLPHLGSATVETREAMARRVCEGVAEVLRSTI